MPNFVKSDVAAVAPSLPTPKIADVGYDEATKTLRVVTEFSMDYPSEAIIQRLGRVPKDDNGNPTGEDRPVTSKIYGKASKLPLGFADDDGNAVLFTGRVFAETKEAEAEAATTEED
jgi:hypothetical protein